MPVECTGGLVSASPDGGSVRIRIVTDRASLFTELTPDNADLLSRELLQAAGREDRLKPLTDALVMALKCATRRIADCPPYPVRVDQMTPREFEITRSCSHAMGTLTFIRDTLLTALLQAHELREEQDDLFLRKG